MRLPAYGIGWAAADLLIRLINHETVDEQTLLLETDLIIRKSSGARESSA
jgi:DNA-binding LacI/PurR family transcriptional regulator